MSVFASRHWHLWPIVGRKYNLGGKYGNMGRWKYFILQVIEGKKTGSTGILTDEIARDLVDTIDGKTTYYDYERDSSPMGYEMQNLTFTHPRMGAISLYFGRVLARKLMVPNS
jgi:hypothetical protein